VGIGCFLFISGQFHKLKRWRLGMMNTHKDPNRLRHISMQDYKALQTDLSFCISCF
jgi:hypothetical protein